MAYPCNSCQIQQVTELDSPSMTELGDFPVDRLQTGLARIFEKVRAEERSFEHGFEKLSVEA